MTVKPVSSLILVSISERVVLLLFKVGPKYRIFSNLIRTLFTVSEG